MENEKTDFIFDKGVKPIAENVNSLLGNTATLWREFLEFIENEVGTTIIDWKFYTKKSGWTMKLLLKKRNFFFFKPQEDSFAITFFFGDHAVNAILESDFPKPIKEDLRNARKYMEGRGIRRVFTTIEDVEIAKKLLKIKLQY